MSNTVKEVDESLELLKETKSNIRSAIEQKGVTVSDADTFASYATKIGEISSGSGDALKNLNDAQREQILFDGTYEGKDVDVGEVFTQYDGKFVEFDKTLKSGGEVESVESRQSILFDKTQQVFIGYERKSDGSYYYRYAKSVNGKDWEPVTENYPFYDFIPYLYGEANGKLYKSTPNYSHGLQVSVDGGVTWQNTTGFSFSNTARAGRVTYGNGIYVCPTSNGSTAPVLVSEDGLNWTSYPFPASRLSGGPVAFNNGVFLTVTSQNSKTAYLSTDGQTWEGVSTPVTFDTHDQSYIASNGYFYAVSRATPYSVYKSADGRTWEKVIDTNVYVSSLVSNGKEVIAYYDNSSTSQSFVIYENGETSTSVNYSGYGEFAYGNGWFVSNTSRFSLDPYYDYFLTNLSYNKEEVNTVIANIPQPDLSEYIKNTATGTNSVTIAGRASSVDKAVNVGYMTSVYGERGTAVGFSASAYGERGTAVGQTAYANAEYAIQIGEGANNAANTMNVGLSDTLNVQLLDPDGKIPAERLPEITEKNEFVTNSNSSASENQKQLYLWEGTVKDYNSQDKEIYALKGIPNRVDMIPVLENVPIGHGTILKDNDFLLFASFEILKLYPSLKKTETLPSPFSDGYAIGIFKKDNTYIAANAYGAWATSTDLVNWQQSGNAPTIEYAYGAAVLNDMWFVFDGGSTGEYAYSTDNGETWTTKESGVEYGNEGIVLNDRLFLLSAGDDVPKVTTDGINWTACNVNIDPDVYVNGVYYGHISTTIYTSTDGITWTSTSMVLPEWPEYNSHLGHNGTHFLYATVTHAYWSTDGINWNSKELAVLQYNNGTPITYNWHGHDIIVFNESWSENAYIWSIFDIDGYVYTTSSDNLKVLDRVYDYDMNDVGQITNIDQVGTDDYSSIFVTLLSNETYSTVRNTTADFTAAVSLDIVNPDAIAIVNNTRTNEFVTIKQNGKDLSNSLYALKPNDMVDLLSTGKINDITIRSGTDFIHPAGCVARYIDYDTLGIKNLISNSIIETVLYGNNVYLAHYYDGIYTSTDLINWEKSQTDFSVYGNIIFDGKQFVGIMEPNDTGYPTIYTSVDGKSWERGTQLASSGTVWYDYLCYNENGYLITEHSTSDVAYPVVFSTDLVNWTNLNPGNDPADYYHICAANSQAFVVGIAETGMTKAYVSTNGTTWTTVTLPETTTSSNSLSVLNDTFIYRLSSNTYKSTDGKNWTLFDYTLKVPNVYYNGNYYVSDDKAIYKSQDAISWEIVSGTEQYNNSNSTGGLETITSNGVMVIAIGTSGLALSAGSYTYFKPLSKTGRELHLYQTDLTSALNGYATTTYVDEQLGDIETLLAAL